MNWVDVVVLTIVAFSGVLGFLNGMVREVFGLAAWIGAGVAAWYFFPDVQGLARQEITNPDVADPVAFGSVFLLVLIMLSLVARASGKLVRGSVLGGLDRTLGLVYGLARGGALMIAVYVIVGIAEPMDRWPDQVLEARTLPSIYLGAVWVTDRIPDEYRPKLAVPPAAGPTDSAQLLHANPVGRALGAPATRQ
jgi:membrane protein required for colicin V production